MGQYYRNPTGTTTLTSDGAYGSSSYPVGTKVQAKVISSHADVGNTNCPGQYLAAQMQRIRTLAAAYLGDGFINPAITQSYANYGHVSPTITATTLEPTAWTLTVTEVCDNKVMQVLSGNQDAAGGLAVMWDGSTSAGAKAPPGQYAITLSGQGVSGPPLPVVFKYFILKVPGAPVGHCPSTPPPATKPANFLFSGAGWGHGLGMSQYGARGQAMDGATATDIVQYYYPNAFVQPFKDSTELHVNINYQAPGSVMRTEALQAGGGQMSVQLGTGVEHIFSQADADTNPNEDRDAYAHADTDEDRDTYRNAHDNSDGDPIEVRNPDSVQDCDADTDKDRNTHTVKYLEGAGHLTAGSRAQRCDARDFGIVDGEQVEAVRSLLSLWLLPHRSVHRCNGDQAQCGQRCASA